MENHLTDDFTRLQINLEKLTQEAELRNAINHKSIYDDPANTNRKTVNSSNVPIPRPRIYSTKLKKSEEKYQDLEQTKIDNLNSSGKTYYGDAKELKASNEAGHWETSNEESLYEEVSIFSLILKTIP